MVGEITKKLAVVAELKHIPGVGQSLAEDLFDLGFRSVGDLRGEDPEAMYKKLCRRRHSHIDRCVLYVFRCAVYYASTKEPDPELLLWWNWKDDGLAFTSDPARA